MARRADDLELAGRYEAGCEAYDELYREEQIEKYEAVLNAVRPAGKVVDVGCGTGLLLEFIVGRGLANDVELYVCVDVSGCMLKIAKDRLARLCGGRCAMIQASAYGLPFKDGSFDIAYSVSVVNLLERPIEAMREVSRVADRAVVTSVTKLGDLERPEGWGREGLAGRDAVYVKSSRTQSGDR
ncbi:MAG: class I SAM-dependent methyltransferase [Acidilobus sp.]